MQVQVQPQVVQLPHAQPMIQSPIRRPQVVQSPMVPASPALCAPPPDKSPQPICPQEQKPPEEEKESEKDICEVSGRSLTGLYRFPLFRVLSTTNLSTV